MSAIPTAAAVAPQPMGLDQLPLHARATVVAVHAPQGGASREHDELVLRLLEIGFLPGEPVRVIAHGFPGREPVAVRLGHTTFALRRHEAALVRVQPAEAGA